MLAMLALLEAGPQGRSVTREELVGMKVELARNGKPVTCRDVLKWCERLASNPLITGIANNALAEQTRKLILD